MVNTNPTPLTLNQPFANGGDKNTIPNDPTGTNLASLEEGFPVITETPISGGGIPPVRRDFNGIYNALSQHNYFQQGGGLYTFNQSVSDAIGGYAEGALLWYIPASGNARLLKSNKANNTDNFITTPSFIGVSWIDQSGVTSYPKDHIASLSLAWVDATSISFEFDGRADDNLSDITTSSPVIATLSGAMPSTPYYLFVYKEDGTGIIKGYFDTDVNGSNVPVNTGKRFLLGIYTDTTGNIREQTYTATRDEVSVLTKPTNPILIFSTTALSGTANIPIPEMECKINIRGNNHQTGTTNTAGNLSVTTNLTPQTSIGHYGGGQDYNTGNFAQMRSSDGIITWTYTTTSARTQQCYLLEYTHKI